jgi:GT2 family glycosyltransferase/predicted O-methyltransferase YrrM
MKSRNELLSYLRGKAQTPSDINEHLELLYSLVADTNAQKIVELGTRGGNSTCALVIGAAETGGHVTSVDHGKGSEYQREGPTLDYLTETSTIITERLGLGQYWTLVVKDDLEFAREYNDEIDVLMIDTSHSYEQTGKELEIWGDKVVDGGFIVMHDTVSYPEQNKAIWEFLDEHWSSNYIEHRNCNGLAIIVKQKTSSSDSKDERSKTAIAPEAWRSRVNRMQEALIDMRDRLREKPVLESKSLMMRNELTKLANALDAKNVQITQLTKDLESILGSPGWRAIKRCRKMIQDHFPVDSRRRRLLERLISPLLGTVEHHDEAVRSHLRYTAWRKRTNAIRSRSLGLQPPKGQMDLIVPVHDAYEEVRECCESIFRNTANYRLIIIDDQSRDTRLLDYLHEIEQVGRATVIRNPTILGFVKSANKGMAASTNDVVLLNSDTVVTKNWLSKLRKCAYSNEKIGTTSPFTNNATICSIPKFFESNQIPPDFTVDSLGELVERVSTCEYPTLPTSPGFCMYVKRSVIRKVGFFDECFSPGYEEENDLCMRALKRGYIAVLDDATFVYHKGSATFRGETKDLQEAHQKIMQDKHPEFSDIITGFVSEDPIKDIRGKINSALLRHYQNTRRKILVTVHNGPGSPGGTEKHAYGMIQQLSDSYLFYLIYPERDRIVLLEYSPVTTSRYEFPKVCPDMTDKLDSIEDEQIFERICEKFKIDLVHIQHLRNFPLSFPIIAKASSLPILLTLNDFYFICPQYMLLENGTTFCYACENLQRCDSCLKKQFDYPREFQARWRTRCAQILSQVDTITCATNSALSYYLKIFDIPPEKICIMPLGVPPVEMKVPGVHKDGSGLFRVGIPGSIRAPFKGREIVLDLIRENSRESIEWHLFGNQGLADLDTYIIERKIRSVSRIVNHADYASLPEELVKNNIDLVLIPSVQPETFSYVLSESWQAGIPAVVPDLVALGERVRSEGAGWTYPYQSEEILKLIYRIMDEEQEYASKKKIALSVKTTTQQQQAAELRQIYELLIQQAQTEQNRNHV